MTRGVFADEAPAVAYAEHDRSRGWSIKSAGHKGRRGAAFIATRRNCLAEDAVAIEVPPVSQRVAVGVNGRARQNDRASFRHSIWATGVDQRHGHENNAGFQELKLAPPDAVGWREACMAKTRLQPAKQYRGEHGTVLACSLAPPNTSVVNGPIIYPYLWQPPHAHGRHSKKGESKLYD